jgi:hypothetical protein
MTLVQELVALREVLSREGANQYLMLSRLTDNEYSIPEDEISSSESRTTLFLRFLVAFTVGSGLEERSAEGEGTVDADVVVVGKGCFLRGGFFLGAVWA